MIAKQNQKGGDASTNIQAENMTITFGIDEKRAREIYHEMNLQVRKEYSLEALDITNKRIVEFENKLMSKMEEVDGALEAFTDPSFQLLLVEAQKTAASTERPADYDLLSELLIHRFKKGANRFTRAGISRAVEIVDEIDDDALLGLTVLHAVSNFMPVSGDIHKGLNVLNNLFGKLFYEKLPVGRDWLDHLDILDAVRLSTFGNLKKIQEYYPEQLTGYIDVGIERNSENYHKAIEILNNNNIPQDILITHVFNDNFVRLNISHKNGINSLSLHKQIVDGIKTKTISIPLSVKQINALNSIYELYKQDHNIKQENIKLFMEKWDKNTNLKMLKDWWDNLDVLIQITSVGKVLAHSNAQRCDKSLPPLN